LSREAEVVLETLYTHADGEAAEGPNALSIVGSNAATRSAAAKSAMDAHKMIAATAITKTAA